MEHVMKTRWLRSAAGSFLMAGVFMALIYFAVYEIPFLLVLAAAPDSFMLVISGLMERFSLCLMIPFMLLEGGVIIRLMHGTREECGLVLRKDEHYLLHAAILGVAASVFTFAVSFQLMLVGYVMLPMNHVGMPPHETVDMLIHVAWNVASAFLLFGVIQAYLMRKTSWHVKLGPWNLPASGIMVLVIASIPYMPMLWGWLHGMHQVVILTLVTGICSGILILAASYWFERSRSLAAPMVAFGVYGGFGFILNHIMQMIVR